MNKNHLIRKGLVCGIILLFVGASVVPSIDGNLVNNKKMFDQMKNLPTLDHIDQQQTNCDGYRPVGEINPYIAQSFKPTFNRLTRIELKVQKDYSLTGNVLVSIRTTLEGEDLTSVSVPMIELPLQDWFVFDFPNITVTPEDTYYIVLCYTIGDSFAWGESHNDYYIRGEAWEYTPGQGWNPAPSWYSDTCFKTYGYSENQPPNSLPIDGPSWGITNVVYTFCINVTDTDGDDIYCIWDWGDGNYSYWLGPYSSNGTICASHSWSQRGLYGIRVKLKDVYGAESGWSDLHVFNVYELKKAFLFGSYSKMYTNLSTEGDYSTVESVNLRMILFKPFQFLHYIDGKTITFSKDTVKALITSRFLIGLLDVVT